MVYGAVDWISEPNLKRSVVFDENFIGVEVHKMCKVFDKPIYIGAAI